MKKILLRGAMAAFAAIACCVPASARDINLDGIYLKATSPYQTKLLLGKLDAWFAVGARLLDREVVFAGWMSGAEIAYVKEDAGTGENLVCVYRVPENRYSVAARVKGDVMHAAVSPSGRYMVMKRLIRRGDIIPEGEIVVVALPGGEQTVLATGNPLPDYTVSPDGNSLYLETEGGIDEYRMTGGARRRVLGRSACPEAFRKTSPTLAFSSPDRGRWVVLSGGGGYYTACLHGPGATRPVRGITSSMELCWLGNTAFAFRSGGVGDHSVVEYRVRDGSTRMVGGGSLNTSISYSPHAGILSWLLDGLIMLYYPAQGRKVTTGLEGEDVFFDPAGSRFTALVGRRLFLADLHSLRSRGIELKRAQEHLLSLYRELSRLPGEGSNEFSREYIGRKIKLYRELLREKH